MGMLKYIADKLYSNDKEVALVEDNGGIESGGDASVGRWTKFPDGTLICTKLVDFTYTTSTAWDSVFVAPNELTHTFPIPFVSPPLVSVMSTPVNKRTWAGLAPGYPSASKVSLIIFGSAIDATGNVGYTAIGRWK